MEFGVITILESYIRELYSIPAKDASYIVLMMFLGLAISSPIIGKLSEKFDNRVGNYGCLSYYRNNLASCSSTI